MVVRISSPHSVSRALNYNEKKVQRGQAECIAAFNYLLDSAQMNFQDKLNRLQDLMTLNERAKKSNTLHISLNFDPSENLSKEKLAAIAENYMDKIGFADQPYLVYAHHDAGHPHLHILTTNIRANGKRIDTYNIGRNQSEKARKEIEISFGLVQAQEKKSAQQVGSDFVPRLQYGKSETKRSISNVLGAVIDKFKYSSLPELNAVLRLYGVTAEMGTNNGILYSALDEQGNRIGVPVKASLFYMKPTFKNLEKKFEENHTKKQAHAKSLKAAIDWQLNGSKKPSLQLLMQRLSREKISVVLRENKEGLIYGITFVDFNSRSVFNGSDLGKNYSAKAILERTATGNNRLSFALAGERKNLVQEEKTSWGSEASHSQKEKGLLDAIIAAEKTFNHVPAQLLKKKKKKKKNWRL